MPDLLLDHIEDEPQTPHEIVDDLISQGYDRLYCLYSGGGDSGCITHFVKKNYPKYFAGTLHADTGMSLQMTRDFVTSYCAENRWGLDITKAPPRKNYNGPYKNKYFTFEEFVLREGFPGPHNHGQIMSWLKYFGWRHYVKQRLSEEPGIALLGGTRKKESLARMNFREYTKMAAYNDSRLMFCMPFLYKSGKQTLEYFVTNGLHKSPSYKYGFDISGDCLCGSYSKFWEPELIRQCDPGLYGEIRRLEKLVLEKGTPEAKQHPKWGKSKPIARLKKKKKDPAQQVWKTVEQGRMMSAIICGSDSCDVDPFLGDEPV